MEPVWVRRLLIAVALSFLGLFLVIPLVSVFSHALNKGLGPYFASFQDPVTWASIQLTLLTAAVAVPLNLVFGVSAAWADRKSVV